MLLMIDNRTAHLPFVLSEAPQVRSRRILSCY